jgi:hypothetical protein
VCRRGGVRTFVQGVAGLADEAWPPHGDGQRRRDDDDGGSLGRRCKGTSAAAGEELVLVPATRGVQRPRSEARLEGHG